MVSFTNFVQGSLKSAEKISNKVNVSICNVTLSQYLHGLLVPMRMLGIIARFFYDHKVLQHNVPHLRAFEL